MTHILAKRDEKGVAIVEFSIVMVLLITLLLGIIIFGMLLAAKQSVTQASSEGARAGVGTFGAFLLTNPNPNPAAYSAYKSQAIDDAEARANEALDWVRGSKPPAAIDVAANVYDCGDATKTNDNPTVGPDCIQVKIKYDNENYPLIPSPWPVSDLTPKSISSDSSAQLDG